MDVNQIQEEFLRTASRFGKMRYDVLFHDMSKREFEMLTVIYRYMEENAEEKGIYVSKLANMLRVTSPAVSRMIGILEEKGYIGRDVDKEDRRNTYVYLTDAGRRIRKVTEDTMQELMKKVVVRMGNEDMQELILLWNRLADIMEEEMKRKNV